MILIIQLIGVLFGVLIMYLSFINLKKKEFTINEWVFWTAIAASFALISLFPDMLNPFIRAFNISRKMDLLIITGFMTLTTVIFYTYNIAMKNQKKLEQLVRKTAMQEAERKGK
ncbi:DUF2304 domain-containing protein [Candidatus Woesearchaeota archaeon]|nr:DUF2304 domain-containing protein [Candidatus Woesearchaeota archaeon]